MSTHLASRSFSAVFIITLLLVYGSLPVRCSRAIPDELSSFSRKLSAVPEGSTIGGGAEQLHRSLQSLVVGQGGEKQSESSSTSTEEREVIMPAVFQMLPRNTKPPPRGPSPGSNAVNTP
ncbi:unnamed protein product [Calypogeia fissa]